MQEFNEEEILRKSLEYKNLTFKKFVEVNEINLYGVFVDRFFHNINDKIPIYMDDKMMEYTGYKESKNGDRLRNVVKKLNRSLSIYKNQLWWHHLNDDYKKYREELMEENPDKPELKTLFPQAKTGRNSSKKGHIVVSPRIFKEFLMLCQTEKGKQVRHYYIVMMEVMELYVKYQNAVVINQQKTSIDDLKRLLETNEKKADEERKKAEKIHRHQQARIDKLLGYAEKADEDRKKADEKTQNPTTI